MLSKKLVLGSARDGPVCWAKAWLSTQHDSIFVPTVYRSKLFFMLFLFRLFCPARVGNLLWCDRSAVEVRFRDWAVDSFFEKIRFIVQAWLPRIADSINLCNDDWTTNQAIIEGTPKKIGWNYWRGQDIPFRLGLDVNSFRETKMIQRWLSCVVNICKQNCLPAKTDSTGEIICRNPLTSRWYYVS